MEDRIRTRRLTTTSRRRRGWLSLVVASVALVAASLAVATPASGVAGFGDIANGRFYTEAVQWMVDNEITTGTSPTCFSPDDPVTRGQAAAFLWRMEGFPMGAPPHPFTDVIASWQQEPVSWMFAEGITTGTSPSTYSPNETLTRGQMAALMHRAAGEPPASPTTFPDVFKAWQLVPVGWMEAEAITTGTTPTTFSPEDPVTRGQFATFAWRWKGEPPVAIDPDSPICPDFFGPIESTPDISGSVGFQLAPGGDSITGFVVNLDIDDYRCPGISVTVTSDGTFQTFPAQPVGIVGGSFAYSSFSQDWTGTISGASASGTVEGAFTVGSGDSCEWGPLNWTATKS